MSAKYRRIHREEGNRPVRSMRRWVKVSESGYYAWRNRPESSTARRREDLTAIIVKFFDESEQTCGYRRIHAELARGGVMVSLGMVRDHGGSRSRCPSAPRGQARTDRVGAGSSGPARPVAPRGHRHRARDETGGRHRAWSDLAGIRLPGGRHGLFLEKDHRARDRRSHAHRTRHRGLGHGRAELSTDPWCHGPPLGSRSSMHVGRMHGIHGRPRGPPVRRADR